MFVDHSVTIATIFWFVKLRQCGEAVWRVTGWLWRHIAKKLSAVIDGPVAIPIKRKKSVIAARSCPSRLRWSSRRTEIELDTTSFIGQVEAVASCIHDNRSLKRNDTMPGTKNRLDRMVQARSRIERGQCCPSVTYRSQGTKQRLLWRESEDSTSMPYFLQHGTAQMRARESACQRELLSTANFRSTGWIYRYSRFWLLRECEEPSTFHVAAQAQIYICWASLAGVPHRSQSHRDEWANADPSSIVPMLA